MRLLPEGGNPNPLERTGLDRRLTTTLNSARHAGQIRLSPAARHAWADTYQQLAQPQPGIAGAIAARAEAHTIRLSLIYALLDTAPQIQPAHLTAALALWNYAQRSASWALERSTANPFAHQIHAALIWTLLRTGHRPVGMVMGSCVYHVGRRGPLKTIAQTGRNVELPNFTQALYEARELAMQRMQTEAKALGAEGIVGVSLSEASHGWGSHVIEFFALGTAIVPSDASASLEPPIQVLDLNDR